WISSVRSSSAIARKAPRSCLRKSIGTLIVSSIGVFEIALINFLGRAGREEVHSVPARRYRRVEPFLRRGAPACAPRRVRGSPHKSKQTSPCLVPRPCPQPCPSSRRNL